MDTEDIAIPEAIVVRSELPALPLVVVDDALAGKIIELASTVESLAVKDDVSNQEAARLLVAISKSHKALDEGRAELKKPFAEVGKLIEEAARAPLSQLSQLKERIKRKMADYDDLVKARAAEAERVRQAKLAELEAEKKRQEEEARKAAEAQKAASAESFEEFDLGEVTPKTEIEKKIDEVKYAPPAVVVSNPAGIRYNVRLVATIEDASKVPDMFTLRVVDETKIRSAFCNGYKEGGPIPTLAGVKFTVEKKPAVTGRGM